MFTIRKSVYGSSIISLVIIMLCMISACFLSYSLGYMAAMASVLVFPNRVGLYLSLVLIGFYNAGRKVSGTVIAFEFCETEDRPTYIGLTNSLMAPFFALGSILGGVLILFLDYRPVFALSMILAGCGVVYMTAAVSEPRHVKFYTGS